MSRLVSAVEANNQHVGPVSVSAGESLGLVSVSNIIVSLPSL